MLTILLNFALQQPPIHVITPPTQPITSVIVITQGIPFARWRLPIESNSWDMQDEQYKWRLPADTNSWEFET